MFLFHNQVVCGIIYSDEKGNPIVQIYDCYAIQELFKNEIDIDESINNFILNLGKFITEAINEKIQREHLKLK